MKGLIWLIGMVSLPTLHLLAQPQQGNFIIPGSTSKVSALSPSDFEDQETAKLSYFNDAFHVIIRVPVTDKSLRKSVFSTKGIRIGNYLGDGFYRASISDQINWDSPAFRQIDIFPVPTFKNQLSSNFENQSTVRLMFPKYMDAESINQFVESQGFQLIRSWAYDYQMVDVEIDPNQLNDIISLPFIVRVDPLESDQPLGLNSPMTTRSVTVNAKSFGTAKGLSGAGVTVGVGDAGEVADEGANAHVDRNYRITNETSGVLSGWGFHGEHIVGSISGLGNKDPRYKGMAVDAEIITEKSSNIIYRMDELYANYGISIVNCSFGPSGNNCANFGTYNSTSVYLDDQMNLYTDLMYVIAAGNSGSNTCNGYNQQFNTVLQSYASAKNALVVAACDKKRRVYNSTVSAGPVRDGRLKPEISAPGTGITSTGYSNAYSSLTGSSMATANVSGTLALLTEEYKLLNGGTNPDAGLLKAIVCNTAYDAGAKGPDFRYGFGVINARRAGLAIENATYFTGSIADGGNSTHTINIPSGTHEVRVMLYWSDESGDPAAETMLVNDLDLTVSKGSENYQPWVLDPTPGNERNEATRGADHLNNIEQVTFEPLGTGSYTINIDGFDIPTGTQNYYIVYEIIKESIVVTYPFGGETFEPNTSEWLIWDAFGPNRENITVEYSVDGGGSWTDIPTYNATSNDKEYTQMQIPDVYTSKALVRASIDGTSIFDQSDYFFTIAPVPTNFSATSCGGLVHLNWDAIENIAGYEILMRDTSMKVIQTTTQNSAIIDGLNPGESHWFAVQAILKDGGAGRHTVSQEIMVGSSTCSSFEDASISAITSPVANGRAFTTSALSGTESISVTVNNLGYQTLTTVPVSYRINGGSTVTESWTGSLLPGESTEYTFSTKVDMSVEGSYEIEAWTSLSGDWNTSNDALPESKEIKQLSNNPILIPSTAEDFESANATLEFEENIGLAGIDRVDFITSAAQGRIRTNAGASFTNGNRAITLDAAVDGERILNELILTYNLDGQVHPELYLSFDFMHHSQEDDPANAVFVRGSDTDPWISIYDLYSNQGAAGSFKSSGDIEMIAPLLANSQSLSSSFQIRFCQAGSAHAIDQFSESGYTFDNIELSDASLAVELVSFEANPRDEKDVLLKWASFLEEDFSHYEVQVAKDDEAYLNNDFESIARVEGLGYTPAEYQILDENANLGYTRYYRLKMIDLDGSFEYSEVRSVSFGVDTNMELIVFPNPVADELSFRIKDLKAGNGNMFLTDLSGRVLMQRNLSQQQDGDFEQIIPIDRHLPSGYYLVKVDMAGTQITKKILRVGEQP